MENGREQDEFLYYVQQEYGTEARTECARQIDKNPGANPLHILDRVRSSFAPMEGNFGKLRYNS